MPEALIVTAPNPLFVADLVIETPWGRGVVLFGAKHDELVNEIKRLREQLDQATKATSIVSPLSDRT